MVFGPGLRRSTVGAPVRQIGTGGADVVSAVDYLDSARFVENTSVDALHVLDKALIIAKTAKAQQAQHVMSAQADYTLHRLPPVAIIAATVTFIASNPMNGTMPRNNALSDGDAIPVAATQTVSQLTPHI